MDEACDVWCSGELYTGVWWGNLVGRDHLVDQVWVVFIWLRTGTRAGAL
jgi:hypothetical protein